MTETQKRWVERGGIAAAAFGLGYMLFHRPSGHAPHHQLHGHVDHEGHHDENERGEYGHKKHRHHHHEDR